MPAYPIITPPSEEPVTLDEMKEWIKQDATEDDNLLRALIVSARDWCETYTNRAFVTQTWRMQMDAFPGYYDHRLGSVQGTRTLGGGPWQLLGSQWGFVLPVAPVQEIIAFKYVDQGGNLHDMPTGAFNVDFVSSPARIYPVFGGFWPFTQYAPNAINIDFVCGYGLAPAVPESIKTAIKFLASWMYNNRDSHIVSTGQIQENPTVTALLSQYRDLRF